MPTGRQLGPGRQRHARGPGDAMWRPLRILSSGADLTVAARRCFPPCLCDPEGRRHARYRCETTPRALRKECTKYLPVIDVLTEIIQTFNNRVSIRLFEFQL